MNHLLLINLSINSNINSTQHNKVFFHIFSQFLQFKNYFLFKMKPNIEIYADLCMT